MFLRVLLSFCFSVVHCMQHAKQNEIARAKHRNTDVSSKSVVAFFGLWRFSHKTKKAVFIIDRIKKRKVKKIND